MLEYNLKGISLQKQMSNSKASTKVQTSVTINHPNRPAKELEQEHSNTN